MRKLVIFGAAAFAEIAHYFFVHDSAYNVVGFTVDRDYLVESRFLGLPVVPFDEVIRHFSPAEHDIFVAMGIGAVNRQRAAKVDEAERLGFRLASFLSSRADVPKGLAVRPHTMIMEHAAIHPYVEIGRDTIIWSASRIGFRTRIGDHCWIVSAILGESVTVGDGTFVGLNATVAPGVVIGPHNIIGAGALILANTGADEVYRGHGSTRSTVPSGRLWKN